MLMNYQYRAYPTTQQKRQLSYWLRICRYWYNHQLGDRFDWWENNRTAVNSCPLVCSLPVLRDNPDFYSQKKQLPVIKEDLLKLNYSGELLDFTCVPSQTLQDVSKRVDLAFSRFNKGDSNGNRSGKPRFKNAARYRTMRIEAQAVTIERVEKDSLFLSLSKLKGWVKVRLHRPLLNRAKLRNLLLTLKSDGWYITICLEDSTVPEFKPDGIAPTWDNSIGLDAVLHEDDYLATSENTKLLALKSFRKSENRLAKVSKRKATKNKGSRSRRKLAKREARVHQRIARSRRDHAFKTAHALVRTGKKVFIHEDLNLKALSKRNQVKQDEHGKYLPNGQSAKSGLNKSWNDAAFGQFFTVLEYIAVKAGARTIACSPQYRSQLLAYRDEFIFIDCDIRSYWDAELSLLIDRDLNAAINLKRVGRGLFPTIKRRKGNPVVTASTTNSTLKEVLETLKCARSLHSPSAECR
ncbi:putative transposase IS605 family protein [Scytonema sp. HK-05]|nr:transposase [Scytonema sp. HK-05]BAY48685.1 putative transposase IS605 family protein [Scytonema sp. HK-05]